MKKECTDIEEVKDLIKELYKDPNVVANYVIDGEKYIVEWMDRKKYTAQDGKEYPEEVWVTQENEMVQVQDMSEEHLRNVLRRLIRNNREVYEAQQLALMEALYFPSASGPEPEVLSINENNFYVAGPVTLQ